MLTALRHLSLPQVFDYFIEAGGKQYLVMEFVDGTDLHALVAQRGVLPQQQLVAWMDQILDALAYLHAQTPPIIHRDIKPQNIILTPQGRALLVDFGIAKVLDQTQRTLTGARAVSPGYSPPEQYGQGTTDARSDIYAVGATMYYATTRMDPSESVQRVGGVYLSSPRTLNPKVTWQMEQVILRAMELQPSQRFQSANEMRRAMSQATMTPPPPVPPTARVPGPAIPAPYRVPPVQNTGKRARDHLVAPIIIGNLLGPIILIAIFVTSCFSIFVCIGFFALPPLLGLLAAQKHIVDEGTITPAQALGDGVLAGIFGFITSAGLIVLASIALDISTVSAPSTPPADPIATLMGLLIVEILLLGMLGAWWAGTSAIGAVLFRAYKEAQT